jgi:SAM-dependent methyltransferase
MSYKTITECQLCRGELVDIWDLGKTPLANSYLTAKQEPETYPLVLCKCENCGEVQLRHLVDPTILFSNYLYLTDYSPSLVSHFEKYAKEIYQRFRRPVKVLEIGSNSGVLLQFFKDLGCDVLGVEPAANLCEVAEKRGIPTIHSFFSEKEAKTIKDKFGTFDVVVANNVLAHVDDLPGIIRGALSLLKDDKSILVFENAYWGDTVKGNYFDQAYHEHALYHSVKPINKLLINEGGFLIDVSFNKIQGGSARFFCSRGNQLFMYPEVENAISEEENSGIFNTDTYKKLQEKFAILRDTKVEEIKKYKESGKTIVIYGFPAKSTTLFTSLIPILEYVDAVVDDSDYKQGFYTPDGKFEIEDPSILSIYYDPDNLVVIVGAWNCFDDIIAKEDNIELIEQGAQFINPFNI